MALRRWWNVDHSRVARWSGFILRSRLMVETTCVVAKVAELKIGPCFILTWKLLNSGHQDGAALTSPIDDLVHRLLHACGRKRLRAVYRRAAPRCRDNRGTCSNLQEVKIDLGQHPSSITVMLQGRRTLS